MAASPRMTSDARREQLLEVTKAIVSERGFHAASIEAVARRAGISRPIVYGHFGDLTGLFQALIDRQTERALGQLADVLPTDLASGDPREQLLSGLRGYLNAVREDPETWRLVLMPPEGAPSSLHERIEAGRAAVVSQLAGAVRPEDGARASSPDPELTARMLSAVSDEAARLVLTDPGRYSIDRIMRHARWVLDQVGP